MRIYSSLLSVFLWAESPLTNKHLCLEQHNDFRGRHTAHVGLCFQALLSRRNHFPVDNKEQSAWHRYGNMSLYVYGRLRRSRTKATQTAENITEFLCTNTSNCSESKRDLFWSSNWHELNLRYHSVIRYQYKSLVTVLIHSMSFPIKPLQKTGRSSSNSLWGNLISDARGLRRGSLNYIQRKMIL